MTRETKESAYLLKLIQEQKAKEEERINVFDFEELEEDDLAILFETEESIPEELKAEEKPPCDQAEIIAEAIQKGILSQDDWELLKAVFGDDLQRSRTEQKYLLNRKMYRRRKIEKERKQKLDDLKIHNKWWLMLP